MAERDKLFVAALKTALEYECKLHEDYLVVLEKERNCLPRFQAENVIELSEKRAEIVDKLKEARSNRMSLIKGFFKYDKRPLTDMIKEKCHPDDAAELIPVALKLKGIIQRSQAKSREFNQIVNFSLSLVSGTLSIFSSATNTVSRSYGRQGTIREAFLPNTTPIAGLTREA